MERGCLARHNQAERNVATDIHSPAGEGGRGRHSRGHAFRRALDEDCPWSASATAPGAYTDKELMDSELGHCSPAPLSINFAPET
jgi:hypothetical protein